GAVGAFRTRTHPDGRGNAGVYVVTASYTDQGAEGAPPITGQAVHVLHSRHKKAAFFDTRLGTEIVDEFEGEHTIVGRFADGDHVSFKDVRLAGIERVTVRAGSLGDQGGDFELRSGSPDGPLLATVNVPGSSGYRPSQVLIQDPGGLIDLFIVARCDVEGTEKVLGLNWIHFHDSQTAQSAREARHQVAEKQLERQQAAANRTFVRSWVVEDLADSMAQVTGGRSFDNGRQLFQTATCVNCHQMGEVGAKTGPELTRVAERMAKKNQPRLALLTEILQPSQVVAEEFRNFLVTTNDGRQLSGMIVGKDEKSIRLVTNPLVPDQVTELDQADVDTIEPTAGSLMPAGLLSTFTRDDILDLLAFLEAGGDSQHAIYRKRNSDD
ncbi:MAG: carbohydrate-binding protein, partial [Planctomycetales bacterium]